jgi:DNA-binding PadR family transcriptional regulator
MENLESLKQNLSSELRRGTLLLMVLSALREAQYGYSLIQHLADIGMKVEQNTLYPLLRRLEKQGLVDSEWVVGESRPRRYYKINESGIEIRAHLLLEWENINQILIKQDQGLEEKNEKLD